MAMMENFINHKISKITGDELYKYAGLFKINITKEETDNIASYLRSERINIFNDDERRNLIKIIAKESNPNTAREVNKLFLQLKEMT